jgi:hypothetical protein
LGADLPFLLAHRLGPPSPPGLGDPARPGQQAPASPRAQITNAPSRTLNIGAPVGHWCTGAGVRGFWGSGIGAMGWNLTAYPRSYCLPSYLRPAAFTFHPKN